MFDAENGLQVFHQLIGSITDPVVQMYRIASLANLDIEKEQEVLAAPTTLALMEKVHEVLLHEKNVNEVRREIAETAKHDIDKQQREHLLRQQKRAIEQALGEEGGGSEETAELREQLDESKPARSGAEGSRSRTEAAWPHVGECGRLSGRAQLSRADRRTAVEHAHRGRAGSASTRRKCSTKITTVSKTSKTGSSKASR